MHTRTNTSGLEKLGFLMNESLCSLKQVQENVVCLVIFCFLQRYKIKVLASQCTSLCIKSNRCGKKNVEMHSGTATWWAIFCIFFSDSIIIFENITTCFWNNCDFWSCWNFHNKSTFYSSYKFTIKKLQFWVLKHYFTIVKN